MGSKHKRKESISARLALLKPVGDAATRRELGEETWVQDEKRGERVAMLKLHEGALPNSKIRRSFDRQLKALNGFEHEGVVEVYEGGTNNGQGRGFLISAGVEGQTLRELLAEAPLPPHDAIGIAVDLLNALSAGHHRWLVHGGISPESVLIVNEDGRPRAKILHYGFAPVVGEARETSFGEVRVALDYAAPESAKGEAVDPRADVYSVGVLLFEMVTGRHPVPATGNDPIRTRILDQADALPVNAVDDAELGGRLKAALKRALEKDPAERFFSARSFALALAGEPLPSEDTFEDPWAWPEACPEGGTCSASGASIPPLTERSWSRKLSDRPFRCRVSGKDFSGAEHWDSRGLCSRGGRHKDLPAPQGEAPLDVVYDDLADAADVAAAAKPEGVAEKSEAAQSAPEGASEKSAAPSASAKDEASPSDTEKLDRRATIRELLRDDARVVGLMDSESEAETSERLRAAARERSGSERTRAEQKKAGPKKADPKKAGPKKADPKKADSKQAADEGLVLDPSLPREERDRSSSGRDLSDSTTLQVEEAFLDAWDGAKRQTEAATSRMKRASTREIGRPVVEGDEDLSVPVEETPQTVGRPMGAPTATVNGDPFRWQVAAAVLGVIVLILGIRLNDEIERTAVQIRATADVGEKLKKLQFQKTRTDGALVQRENELGAAKTQLNTSQTDLKRTKKQLKTLATKSAAAQAKLSETVSQLTARGEKVSKELAAAKQEGSELTKSLAGARALHAAELEAKAKLSGTLAEREKALGSARQELQTLRGERDRLVKESRALASERDRLGKELRGSKAELANSEAQLRSTRSALTALEGSLSARSSERDSLARALAKREAALKAQGEELEATQTQRDQARAALATLETSSRKERLELTELRTRLKGLETQLASLTRERGDLLVELADLQAERERLDAEGLQLERWLREAEARGRNQKKTATSGTETPLRLRSVAANGQAKDATTLSLPLGERGLAVVESAAVAPWLAQAAKGEILVTLRVRCKGGAPVLKLQGWLAAARVERPSSAGSNLRLEKVSEGEYRAWLTKDLLARLKEAPAGSGLGILLVGGSNPSVVERVELRASPLSEDARGLLEKRQGR